jgi:hypothetical protein
MDEIDIWRSARIMMAELGDGAELAASMWTERMYLERDRQAFRLWVRITAAIIDLERTGPGDTEFIH